MICFPIQESELFFFNVALCQTKNGKLAKKSQPNVSKMASSVFVELPRLQANSKNKIVGEVVKGEPKPEATCSSTMEKDVPSRLSKTREFGTDDHQLPNQSSRVPSQPPSPPNRGLILF